MVRQVELAWPVTDRCIRQVRMNAWSPTCTTAWTPGTWGLMGAIRRHVVQADHAHGAQAALMARYADRGKTNPGG